MQSWLLLDAMGVVYPIGDDVRDLLFPFLRARNPALEFSRLQEAYIQASLGRLSCDAFWLAMGYEDPGQIQHEYLSTCLSVDKELYPALTKLRERYHLAMLSNDVGEWSQFLRQRFDLCGLFEYAIISGGVGLRKPDPKIYKTALAILGAHAADCVFVDDLPRNLLPAREMGFRVVLFDRSQTYTGELESVRSFGELAELLL